VKQLNFKFFRISIILFIGLFIFAPNFTIADDQAKTEGIAKDEKIYIESDSAKFNQKTDYGEFIGNVIVTQGTFKITCDRLEFYLKKGAESTGPTPSADALEKIIAKGNVQITSEKMNADTDQLEYYADAKKFVLTGPNTKFSDGKNWMTGSKITYYQDEGRMEAEADPNQRVKMEIQSDTQLME
jgi:lipopolysaccharide export system protein LptA